MSTFRSAFFAAALCVSAAALAQGPNLGRPLTPEEIEKIDITIAPDGSGLPEGSGSVSSGAAVYKQKCQGCHGADGAGKPMEQLTGGIGTLASGKAVKTPMSYWPNATTLFDYIRRAMPFTQPRSLTDDEVYALVAYILAENKLIGENDAIDAVSLPKVRMPNRDNFVVQFPDRM